MEDKTHRMEEQYKATDEQAGRAAAPTGRPDESEKPQAAGVTVVNVPQAKSIYPNGSFIGDDIVIFDSFSNVPMPPGLTRMDCIFVALCTRGMASYVVDTKPQAVAENDIIIINKDQMVSDYMLSRDCEGLAFICAAPFFGEIVTSVHDIASLFLFSRTHPVFHLNEHQARMLKDYAAHIKATIDNPKHPFRRELTATLFKCLIYELGDVMHEANQHRAGQKNTRSDAIFTDFIKLVEANFRTERRVGWYAEQLCITPKYLSETVKTVSRRTPNDWIDSYVSLEMRNLLRNTTMNIKEITQAMNFPNQSFLGKFFKEHVGMSPSQYRKS